MISPDEKLLFIRRNTESEREASIWTDAIDISANPIRTVMRGPDCCMEADPKDTTTDDEGLEKHGLKVLEIARAAGAVR